MLNYFKNFLIKLLLLPIIAVLGMLLMLLFLFHPTFKIFQVKSKHWRDQHGRKEKDYEAFY
jgi:hypothetical protein